MFHTLIGMKALESVVFSHIAFVFLGMASLWVIVAVAVIHVTP